MTAILAAAFAPALIALAVLWIRHEALKADTALQAARVEAAARLAYEEGADPEVALLAGLDELEALAGLGRLREATQERDRLIRWRTQQLLRLAQGSGLTINEVRGLFQMPSVPAGDRPF